MNKLSYKGYIPRIEFDAEDGIFVGHITGIRDIVSFHGQSVQELESAFQEAVDDYLNACKELNQEPNKPYSGKLMLRVTPEVHAAVANEAEGSGKSINQWATEVLNQASQA